MGVDTIAMKTEATRASAVVMLEPKSLVEFLMDAVSSMLTSIDRS
jgi:hypothetical protein